MIDVLISLLVYCVVLGLIFWVISLIPMPAPFHIVARVIFAIIAIILLLSLIGVVPGWGPHHWVR